MHTMSNFLKSLTLLFLFGAMSSLRAQQISAADQKGIEECFNSSMAAIEKMDAAAFGSLLTENAVQIDPMGNIVRGRANLINHFSQWFAFLKSQPKPDRAEHKTSNWASQYLATDLILSTYTEEISNYFGDKAQTEKNAVCVFLRKQNGKWLVELITLTPVVEMPGGAK